MLNTSGFKWDDERSMISVERTVYDEYCKVHSNCKNLYGKSFIYFNTLMEIYGKDYATGKSVEGFVDAVTNIEKTTHSQLVIDSSDDDDDDATNIDDNVFQTEESGPPPKKMKRENRSKHKGKKKALMNSELTSLQGFMKDMNMNLSSMSNVMACSNEREKDAHEREQQALDKSEKLLDELLTLEGITQQQALKVAQILVGDSSKLMLFFKCPHALKVMYVNDLLGDKDD